MPVLIIFITWVFVLNELSKIWLVKLKCSISLFFLVFFSLLFSSLVPLVPDQNQSERNSLFGVTPHRETRRIWGVKAIEAVASHNGLQPRILCMDYLYMQSISVCEIYMESIGIYIICLSEIYMESISDFWICWMMLNGSIARWNAFKHQPHLFVSHCSIVVGR